MSIDYSCTQLDPEELAEHHARLQAEYEAGRRKEWQEAQTAHTITRQRANSLMDAPLILDFDTHGKREVRERQRTGYAQPTQPDPRKMRPRQTVRVRYWAPE